ncbi:MAG: light-regulated signal transduction histidine kinase (bacteriophytochrome) [Planctomycetota bacterium]
MGTLCVIDHEPRELTKEQIETLTALARQTVCQLELRRSNAELHVAADELERANHDLQQFTSVAAHDLREPLRKLSSLSELLRVDLGDNLPAQASESLEYIINSSHQMEQLVTSLLELAKASPNYS